MAIEYIRQLRETDVSDLDFHTLGVWPPIYRILVLVVVFALILLGSYYFHIKDLNQTHARIVKNETKLRKEFERKAFEAANLQVYRNQLKETEASFAALLSQLPTDTEVPGMLEDITEIGLGSSLEIKAITLQRERSAKYYRELPIRIEATGSYHDFGTFVSGIASLPRIVTLHNFNIRTIGNSGRLRFVVIAKTYRYKPEGV